MEHGLASTPDSFRIDNELSEVTEHHVRLAHSTEENVAEVCDVAEAPFDDLRPRSQVLVGVFRSLVRVPLERQIDDALDAAAAQLQAQLTRAITQRPGRHAPHPIAAITFHARSTSGMLKQCAERS